MDGNKLTIGAALIAAIASAYSAYQSGTAARESAVAAANSNMQVAALQKATTDRQSDIEMVKLALNILGGAASDKTQESRIFAVNLLSKYSGVVVDQAVGQRWAETGTVSFAQKDIGLALSTIGMYRSATDLEQDQKIVDRVVAEVLRQSAPSGSIKP